MALTTPHKLTIRARIERDDAFRAAFLAEGVNALFEADVGTGKALLRDYIEATVGFEALEGALGARPNSLARMFSAAGEPSANMLFAVIHELQASSGVRLQVSAA